MSGLSEQVVLFGEDSEWVVLSTECVQRSVFLNDTDIRVPDVKSRSNKVVVRPEIIQSRLWLQQDKWILATRTSQDIEYGDTTLRVSLALRQVG